MKILFLSRYEWPHIGGVEKHVFEVSKLLKKQGYKVKVISKKDIKYPAIKFIGLLYIWSWFFKNISLIKKSDIVHCHDVFIWYLPFRFLFPFKKVYTTFHGWEGIYPIPLKNILLKRLAWRLSNGSISIGDYINKWYRIKSDFVSYGAANKARNNIKKTKSIVFVGRLEKDTGIEKLFSFLKRNKGYKVDFCGDGSLREICEKYGTVHGFCDPKSYYRKASICFASGYLTALEALNNNCKLMVGSTNPIKEDYWELSPFFNKNQEEWFVNQTWSSVSVLYAKLWMKSRQPR